MKKILCALLAGVLLFSGCSIVHEDTDRKISYQIEEKAQQVNLEPSITINPVLYFLDKSGKELAAETRKLSVEQGERAEQKIIEELLAGPQTEELQPVAEGYEYADIEILPDLINVYLITQEEKDENNIAKTKLAIAATLIDFAGVSYVNVFINGMQKGYAGLPVGVLQKTKSGLVEEINNKYKGIAAAETPAMTATLYFLDNTEQFLVPEERAITFEGNTPQIMLETLVTAMIRGPENTFQHVPVIDKSLVKLLGATIEQTEDGRQIARLDFSKAPVVLTEQFKDGEDIAAKALARTITGFMPELAGIEIYVRGEPQQAEQKIYTLRDSDALLGNSIQLYFPNSGYAMLLGVERMVGQAAAGYPYELLSELMRGPVSTDKKEISPAFLSGISMEDVNNAYLAGDIAVVDFNGSVSDKIKNIGKSEEAMMIYSIVNTMTNIDGIKRVQFLLDGGRVQSLGGGEINVMDPLLRNPGIIVSYREKN